MWPYWKHTFTHLYQLDCSLGAVFSACCLKWWLISWNILNNRHWILPMNKRYWQEGTDQLGWPHCCSNLAKKKSCVLQSMKNELGLKVSGVYSMPSECGKVYVGQTGLSIEKGCKEQTWHLCLFQVDKSAVTIHSTELGHQIKFQGTEVLAKIQGYMDWFVKEAIEIWLHLNNLNRKESFKLGQPWNMTNRLLQL